MRRGRLIDQATIRIYRVDHALLRDIAGYFSMSMVDVVRESLALWIAAKRAQSPIFSAYLDERHPP